MTGAGLRSRLVYDDLEMRGGTVGARPQRKRSDLPTSEAR